jgi:branched-subunit amino acid transport protein
MKLDEGQKVFSGYRQVILFHVIITVLHRMRVLITVGSTRFDALVETALSQPVINALRLSPPSPQS